MFGVVYVALFPASNVPPVAALYQSYVPPGAVAVNVAGVLAHTDTPAAVGAAGGGFTVIVYEFGVPAQPFTVGITVMVAVTGLLPVLVAVNASTLPVPLATRPIDGSELVQVYVAPAGVLVKLAAGTVALLHTVIFAGTVTVAVGFTVIVYVTGDPVQPLAVAVTAMVAVNGEEVVLVAVNAAILPMPLAARPIDGSELVHVNVPPAGVLVNVVPATVPLLHTVSLAGTLAIASGFTVTVAVAVPMQPLVLPVTT
jgi:hypothetical protein